MTKLTELTQAVKNICLNPTAEDHSLIFNLHSQTLELENRLDLLKLRLQSNENIKIQELKNQLNITLIENGYENIDETIEVSE